MKQNLKKQQKTKQSISFKKWYAKKSNQEKVKKAVALRLNNLRFGGQRQEILERDNWACQKCGMSQEQHILLFNRGLTIDHIDGQGRKSKNPNNDPENLITLCLRCHGFKDTVRRWNK